MRERVSRKAALSLAVAAFCFQASCSSLETRPYKQMSYAEAAFRAATLAGAETNPDTSAIYQLAKDSIQRARSYYRLKSFKEARKYAIRARRLSEEAELKTVRAGDSNNVNLLQQ